MDFTFPPFLFFQQVQLLINFRKDLNPWKMPAAAWRIRHRIQEERGWKD